MILIIKLMIIFYLPMIKYKKIGSNITIFYNKKKSNKNYRWDNLKEMVISS